MDHEQNWKSRLYQAYVSSGQAMTSADSLDATYAQRCHYFRSRLQAFLPPDRSVRILDLGCGTGMLVRYLRAAGYTNCSGVDVSDEATALARRQGVEVETGQLMTFLSREAEGSVGLVFLLDVLEHLRPEELFPVLDEVHRVLVPAGRLVIHVPNGEGLFGMSIRYGDFTHELAFTRQSVSQVLASCNFGSVRCWEDKPLVHGPTSLIRRVLWDVGSLALRVLSAAESGSFDLVLSRNMTVDALACKRR